MVKRISSADRYVKGIVTIIFLVKMGVKGGEYHGL